MHEFDAVSVSTYEAASLAGKLAEKSADGWEVVAIVPAGSDIVAYVKRASTEASADAAATPVAEVAAAAAAATDNTSDSATAAVAEPAGWGSAPAATGSTWGSTSTSDSGSTGSWGSTSATPAETSGTWGGGSAATTPAAAGASTATPSVPAGWYHDPAGRFELRYWDGSAWTEHVSRAGQQYTDPPVA